MRERVEKLNSADGLVFSSEKQLKDYGDKIPADQKATIEAAINKLRDAHKAEDLSTIDTAIEELNAAWQAASQHMYAAGNEGAAQGGGDGQQQQQQSTGNNDGGVADAEYEEVK